MPPVERQPSHAQISLYPSNVVKQVFVKIVRVTGDVHEVEPGHFRTETLPSSRGFHNPATMATAKVKNI
jgi:hypothetical protein